ncbi:glycosyltransferase [Caulobacter segnis]
MKAALVHYWLVGRRGGEAVLDALGEILPDADLFAHVIRKESLFGSLKGRETYETFIGGLPFARSRYQMYLPLMPLALEALDMRPYDLIVSSEAGPAKWVIPNPDARHICYCHSPLRYIWDQRQIYFEKMPGPVQMLAEGYASHLRKSDVISSSRVDDFVANSNFVKQRIWKYYRREARVIHPPVSVDDFLPVSSAEDFYLVAGEVRSYKRVDLAVRACTALGRRLIVIGGGAGVKELKKIAGPSVEFLGHVEFAILRDHLARCRALLFPGVEDFGIVPVEAMASGRPVIAYAKGGALDSVKPEVSGVLFKEPTVESLTQAILEFEANESGFTSVACVEHARGFSKDVFKARFEDVLREG